jgi:hypothetical protein
MKPLPGRRIQIHIEKLILEDRAGADRIGETMRSELSRQVAEQQWSGLGRGFTEIERVDAGEITMVERGSAVAQGKAIARAAFQALKQVQSGSSIGSKVR